MCVCGQVNSPGRRVAGGGQARHASQCAGAACSGCAPATLAGKRCGVSRQELPRAQRW